jgi:hypothetical protein
MLQHGVAGVFVNLLVWKHKNWADIDNGSGGDQARCKDSPTWEYERRVRMDSTDDGKHPQNLTKSKYSG